MRFLWSTTKLKPSRQELDLETSATLWYVRSALITLLATDQKWIFEFLDTSKASFEDFGRFVTFKIRLNEYS